MRTDNFLFPDLADSPYPEPRDPCARKHGGNETSENAYESTKESLPRMRQRVFSIIEQRGRFGATVKEVASALDKGLNAVSPRITELLDAEAIADSGRRRDGCRVMVVKEG